jgi:hypothetical protein
MRCRGLLCAFLFVGLLAASSGFAQAPGCPDGENLTLSDDTLFTQRTYVVCDTVTLGPNYSVAGPNGHLILKVGNTVKSSDDAFGDAFSVGTDGWMTVDMCIAIGSEVPCVTDPNGFNECCPAIAGEDQGMCQAGTCVGCLGVGQTDCCITPCCPGLVCANVVGSAGLRGVACPGVCISIID